MILVASLAFVGTVYYLFQPSKGEELTYRLDVPLGTSLYKISKELAENSIVKNDKVFYYYSRYKNASVKSGVYNLNSRMTFDEILDLLASGRQEYISVSIPEGLTITEIAKVLEKADIVSKDEFINATKDSIILAKYDIPAKTLEGYLFPDTYFFTHGMSATTIVELMVENFFTKLSQIENADSLSTKELYETVKLASIVEKEYKLKEEAPLIASVFKNRLKYNIGLYSCATIIYIITEIQGLPHPDRVLNSDLKIESPYNTYLYAGLTPTPISNPGLVALNASINTPKTKYYYFRVEDEEKGSHVFTTDFESHKEAGK